MNGDKPARIAQKSIFRPSCKKRRPDYLPSLTKQGLLRNHTGDRRFGNEGLAVGAVRNEPVFSVLVGGFPVKQGKYREIF